MRIGFNPNKDNPIIENDFFHQIVIPVYIPNFEGYFKDSFSILKYCLHSLFANSHDKTFITVISNGSCDEVVLYLNDLLQKKKINELITVHNIGKINAIIKGISGHNFQLITVTDADVMFLKDWQKETYHVFNHFPKAGLVGLVPNSKMVKHLTANVVFDNYFSKKLKFTKVENPNAMQKFGVSVGNENYFKDIHLQKYLTLDNNNCKAVIGSGHFVATYRGDIFKELPFQSTAFALGGDSENLLLDYPVVKNGFWRLTTPYNHAYHMGNTNEQWMVDLNTTNESVEMMNFQLEMPVLASNSTHSFSNWFKNKLFYRINYQKKIWKLFLQLKGLTQKEAQEY